ncbi:MAG: HAD family hydrolase [Chryseotalea sp. WA131a]|jgi:histidinol-phosphate phosphatase family protein|nr:MAG: HAD family hydrolase [Chryseotalea sp. WA131a]
MNSWTLFLDRDGVLNRKIENGYVTNPDSLIILPGAIEAVNLLSDFFQRIFIVTNQRGIAKGLFSHQDLLMIHEKLTNSIRQGGGRIDRIFYCPHNNFECNCRKPDVGMALQAKKEFPNLRFDQSIMIGDSHSDILFGSKLGMKTVFISDKKNEYFKSDFTFVSLLEFAHSLRNLNLFRFQ